MEGRIRYSSGPALIGTVQRRSTATTAAIQVQPQARYRRKVSQEKSSRVTFGAKISPPISLFSRDSYHDDEGGRTFSTAFDIVAEGTDHEKMRELIQTMRTDVSSGTGLAGALEKHPLHFDELFCSLVASGESSGTLEVMLDRVATYKEKTEALKAKIKKAMTYPIATIVVAIVVTAILLVKVVPQFAETFRSFGSDLPGFTLFVLRLSEWVQSWWFTLLLCFFAASYLFSQAKHRSQRFADWLDTAALKLPILGGVIHDAVIARFSRTLSTTFAAGVPLVEALESTAGAAGNALYARAIRQIRDDVTAGTSLALSIRTTGLFPTMLLQMTSIGEESGSLDDMLGKVADHYEAAVDNAVDSLSSLIEPIIMSVLGVLIGGLMIAMYLPIFMLGSVL